VHLGEDEPAAGGEVADTPPDLLADLARRAPGQDPLRLSASTPASARSRMNSLTAPQE